MGFGVGYCIGLFGGIAGFAIGLAIAAWRSRRR